MNSRIQKLSIPLSPRLLEIISAIIARIEGSSVSRDELPYIKDGILKISPIGLKVLIEFAGGDGISELDIRRIQRQAIEQVQIWIELETDQEMKAYAQFSLEELKRAQPGIQFKNPPRAHIAPEDLAFIV